MHTKICSKEKKSMNLSDELLDKALIKNSI